MKNLYFKGLPVTNNTKMTPKLKKLLMNKLDRVQDYVYGLSSCDLDTVKTPENNKLLPQEFKQSKSNTKINVRSNNNKVTPSPNLENSLHKFSKKV